MRFEGDDVRSRTNLQKHRISFETAVLTFDDPHAISSLERIVEGQERWQTLGMAGGKSAVLIAHPYRERNGREMIRIIPARKATASERKVYEAAYESAG